MSEENKNPLQQLQEENAVLKEQKAALEAENKTLADQVEESKSEASRAVKKVEEMSSLLNAASATESEGNIVTIKKKCYRLLGKKFITTKGELTADQLKKDRELLENMLSIGSGSLVPIKV